MLRSKFRNGWSKAPRWAALALGFGPLLAGNGGAAKAELQPGSAGTVPPAGRRASADEVVVRTDGDRVFLSQGGGAFEELPLGNTPEATYLRRLLGAAGAGGASVTVPVGTIIVANGGGQGDGTKPKDSTGATSSDKEQSAPTKTSAPEKPKADDAQKGK